MACLQIYQELLSLATFLRVHSNSEEVSYLSWQKRHPNLKTTCHIKLKFFLWTKLLVDLLLARYLISVAVPLNDSEVLIVFKLPELSRSCSKRIINIFQLSQLMFWLPMESFEAFIWKVFKKILFIKSILFWKKNKKQN